MNQIFVYIPHKNGIVDDIAFEFLTAADKIEEKASLSAVVTGCGDNLDKVVQKLLTIYPNVIKLDNEAFAYPNAEIIRKALTNTIDSNSIVLLPHDTFGMDLGPGLSVKMDSAYASDIVDFEGVENNLLKMVRQELGGAVSTHVTADISFGAVITIRPGAFTPIEKESLTGELIDMSSNVGDLLAKRKFLEVVPSPAGDVDITKSDVLVSIGRGIEEEENVEIADELAKALNAVVSCSRPIVDAKWLEKSRQVGTSGQTVKPKVYLALGISGSFQHMGGIKGNPFIVAINKNPKAPVFQVADIGIVADILDFVPELTQAICDL